MWDWVEINMFSNMADSVNTSLGVHLFENLQALKAAVKTFKRRMWTGSFTLLIFHHVFVFFSASHRTLEQPFPPPPLSLRLAVSLKPGVTANPVCLEMGD